MKVKISDQVVKDLREIRKALYDHNYLDTLKSCDDYVNDIREQFYIIETTISRTRSQYNTHKIYGQYVHRYKRNHTTWYIIYDIDNDGDITIKKILNNHVTVSGISGLPGTRNNNILKTLLLAAGIYALYKITSK